jgi:hypothetical protein
MPDIRPFAPVRPAFAPGEGEEGFAPFAPPLLRGEPSRGECHRETKPDVRPGRNRAKRGPAGSRRTGSRGDCDDSETWLARDGQRRCLNCEPPLFASEVVGEALA